MNLKLNFSEYSSAYPCKTHMGEETTQIVGGGGIWRVTALVDLVRIVQVATADLIGLPWLVKLKNLMRSSFRDYKRDSQKVQEFIV